MLVLTRKIGQKVVIDEEVYLTVLGIKGNQVRLGFDAPEEISVNREEIHQKIKREQTLFLKETGYCNAKQSRKAH
ncbi:MAG: carbon storage regulator CsrA [Legionella sp.]|nr:carbon storage regulator CsrA [Legionella sp.]